MSVTGIGNAPASMFGAITSRHPVKDPVRPTPTPNGTMASNVQNAPRPAAQQEFGNVLRSTMQNILQSEVRAWLNSGEESVDTARREILGLSAGNGQFDIDSLPQSARDALVGLQEASEQLEAIFVKDLLGRMRKSSLSGEESMYSDLAREMFDEQIAKQIASSPNSFGLAKGVFRQNALDTLRRSVSSAPTQNP